MTDDLDPRWQTALRAHRTATEATPDAWAGIVARAEDDDVLCVPRHPMHPLPRTERRRWPVAAAVAAAAVVVFAAGTGALMATRGDPAEVARSEDPTTTTTETAPTTGDPLVVGTGRVVEDATGTHLCGARAEDLVARPGPPTCGEIPLVGWDWDAVQGERTEGGTTWISSTRVVGTYDGERITIADEPSPGTTAPPNEPDPDIDPTPSGIPCPEPPGGWQVTDPTKVGLEHYLAFRDAAEADPQFTDIWVDEGVAPPYGVYVVAFTADLDRHRAELAAIYGGPICVTEGAVSAAALAAAQDTLGTLDPEGDGFEVDGHHLDLTGFGPDGRTGVLGIDVVFAPVGAEEALSEVLGVPVRLTGFLRQIG